MLSLGWTETDRKQHVKMMENIKKREQQEQNKRRSMQLRPKKGRNGGFR